MQLRLVHLLPVLVLVAGCAAEPAQPDTPQSVRSLHGVALQPGIETIRISGLALWRYEPATDKWLSAPEDLRRMRSRGTVNQLRNHATTNPVRDSYVFDLVNPPPQIGLYWMSYLSDGVRQGGFIVNGPVSCNDVDLGEPPPGRVPACVPSKDSARAQFVPDPKLHCK